MWFTYIVQCIHQAKQKIWLTQQLMYTSRPNLSGFALERETEWKMFRRQLLFVTSHGHLRAKLGQVWLTFVLHFAANKSPLLLWFCALPFPTSHEAFWALRTSSRHVRAVAGRNLEQTYGAVLSKRKIRCAQNYLKVSPAFFPATLHLNALVYVQHTYSLSCLMVYTLCCRSLTQTIEPFVR